MIKNTTPIATNMMQSVIMMAQGYDPDTADMCFIDGILTAQRYKDALHCEQIRNEERNSHDFFKPKIIKPSWSLPALLSLLPRGNTTVFHLCMGASANPNIYHLWDSLLMSPGFKSEAAVEAVFMGLIWLTFNRDKIK